MRVRLDRVVEVDARKRPAEAMHAGRDDRGVVDEDGGAARSPIDGVAAGDAQHALLVGELGRDRAHRLHDSASSTVARIVARSSLPLALRGSASRHS